MKYPLFYADEEIGATGDLEGSIFGLDVGIRDSRLQTGRNAFVSPDRWCDEDNPHITERCFTTCFF